MPLPEQIETIFDLRSNHSTVLHVDKEHLKLICFFFARDEIDFDLDPHNFQGNMTEQQVPRLLDFIRTVGKLLNKAVVLTPELDFGTPFFRFDPETHEEKWYLENIDRVYQWSYIQRAKLQSERDLQGSDD